MRAGVRVSSNRDPPLAKGNAGRVTCAMSMNNVTRQMLDLSGCPPFRDASRKARPTRNLRFGRSSVRSNHGFEVWDGKAVIVAVAVGVPVGGGGGVAVAVPVAVPVGRLVEVETRVAVCVTVGVRVRVGKTMETGVSVAVAVARGVRVGTFGTQMDCPVDRPYWLDDIQLANWS